MSAPGKLVPVSPIAPVGGAAPLPRASETPAPPDPSEVASVSQQIRTYFEQGPFHLRVKPEPTSPAENAPADAPPKARLP